MYPITKTLDVAEALQVTSAVLGAVVWSVPCLPLTVEPLSSSPQRKLRLKESWIISFFSLFVSHVPTQWIFFLNKWVQVIALTSRSQGSSYPTSPTFISPKEKYTDMHQAGCKGFKFKTLPYGFAEKFCCENGFDLAPDTFKSLGFLPSGVMST